MKCHFIHDKIAGKVLIPGCIGAAVHNDIHYCTCGVKYESTEERLLKLEKLCRQLKSEIKKLKNS